MEGCFVCYQPTISVIVEADIGGIFIRVPLCRDCERRLRTLEKYLVVCLTCGTFRIMDYMSAALLKQKLFDRVHELGKINILTIGYCQTCELIGIESIGHA
jgi:hypothetical protein